MTQVKEQPSPIRALFIALGIITGVIAAGAALYFVVPLIFSLGGTALNAIWSVFMYWTVKSDWALALFVGLAIWLGLTLFLMKNTNTYPGFIKLLKWLIAGCLVIAGLFLCAYFSYEKWGVKGNAMLVMAMGCVVIVSLMSAIRKLDFASDSQ